MSVFVKVAVMDHSYDVLQRDDIRGQEAKVPERVISFLRAHDALDGVPVNALLEVLVNALAHRDVERGSAVMVKAFPDRIEVVSLGGLLDDLDIEDLVNGVNVERNRELAARACAGPASIMGWAWACRSSWEHTKAAAACRRWASRRTASGSRCPG